MTSPREGYCAPVPAPLLRRFGAVLYEALLLAALVLITGFVLLPITSGASMEAIVIARPIPRAISFAVIVLVVGVYCVHFWSNGRRTLPMKTWRLELVRHDGSALPVSTAIGRYAAAWVGPVLALAAYVALRDLGHARQGLWLLAFNYAWAFFDRERLFLHDRLAGTHIVAG